MTYVAVVCPVSDKTESSMRDNVSILYGIAESTQLYANDSESSVVLKRSHTEYGCKLFDMQQTTWLLTNQAIESIEEFRRANWSVDKSASVRMLYD